MTASDRNALVSRAKERLAPIANRDPGMAIEAAIALIESENDHQLAEFLREFARSDLRREKSYTYHLKFSTDESQLTDEFSIESVEQAAFRARSHLSRRRWRVVGHASHAEQQRNPLLPKQRATAIADALVVQGVRFDLLCVEEHSTNCDRCVAGSVSEA